MLFQRKVVCLQLTFVVHRLLKILMPFLLKVMISVWFVCLTACETWTIEEGVASSGATLIYTVSLSQCLTLCLEMSSCVAVDFSVLNVCGVHTNINNTASTFNLSGFTQYTLNRACQPSPVTLTSSTSSTAGTETSTLTTYSGE